MATRIKAKKKTAERPVKESGYCSDTLHAKRDKRRREALARNAAYAAATPAARLESLDARNLEARRERARLYPLAHNVEVVK